MYNSIFVASVFLAVFSQSRVTNASNFNPNVEENDLGNTMLEPGCASGEVPCLNGHTCNTTTDECTCGATPSCVGQPTGEYCDAENGSCKCSPETDACKYPEVCHHVYSLEKPICLCGFTESCAGKVTGSYCDPVASECKCSKDVDACAPGNVCVNGTCQESTDIQPTESISCIDTWGSDCSQFVDKCSDPDYEWYQKACKRTCGKC